MSITGDTFGLDEAIIHEKVNDRFKGKSVNRLISFISEHKILGVDNLEEFIGYKIKIVFSGTNEAKAPRLKDLRTIALA